MERIESINDWIVRQDWTDAMKVAARELHEARIDMRLNPFTLGQWRTWARHHNGSIAA